MGNLSIIIPAFREKYLNRTMDSLLENAIGEIEIIVVLDGYTPKEPIREDPRVKIITLNRNVGMRGAFNIGLAKATGKFLMKIDAHCIVCKGFDEITNDCKDNWLMIPRRYSLGEEKWERNEKLPVRDYHYLCFPGTADLNYGYSFQVVNWPRNNPKEIDDTMIYQGSLWVANRKYFMDHVGLLDTNHYGPFVLEQVEEGLKYWLGGGEVKVNKKFWYAHLQKRGFHYKDGTFSHRHKKDQRAIDGNEWATKHWMNNEEPGMTYPFSWLIAKFSPIPTWEDSWQEVWKEKSGN